MPKIQEKIFVLEIQPVKFLLPTGTNALDQNSSFYFLVVSICFPCLKLGSDCMNKKSIIITKKAN